MSANGIHLFLDNLMLKTDFISIQDDFHYFSWNPTLPDNQKGKPLYIRNSQKHITHLFFDDNLSKNSVINIYDLDTNE